MSGFELLGGSGDSSGSNLKIQKISGVIGKDDTTAIIPIERVNLNNSYVIVNNYSASTLAIGAFLTAKFQDEENVILERTEKDNINEYEIIIFESPSYRVQYLESNSVATDISFNIQSVNPKRTVIYHTIRHNTSNNQFGIAIGDFRFTNDSVLSFRSATYVLKTLSVFVVEYN